MLYSLFWVIPLPLNFIRPNSLIQVILSTYTAYEDGTGCSETSAYKTPTPGNHRSKEFKYMFYAQFINSHLFLKKNLILHKCLKNNFSVFRTKIV